MSQEAATGAVILILLGGGATVIFAILRWATVREGDPEIVNILWALLLLGSIGAALLGLVALLVGVGRRT